MSNFVVIGTGVAATAVVTKILEKNPSASVTMLEAGGQIKLRDFSLFQNYLLEKKLPFDQKTVYDSYYDLPYGEKDREGENVPKGNTLIPLEGSRLFAYGGSTTHWGGWSFRLMPEDFESWPIDYNHLHPYYNKAEQFLGVSGCADDVVAGTEKAQYPFPAFPYTREDGLYIKAFKDLGYSYSHLPIARYGVSPGRAATQAPCQTTGTCKYCPFGARFAAANYLDDFKKQKHYRNLNIINYAIVTKIIMASKTKAAGVEYIERRTGEPKTLLGDVVIVASGAIESTKLLMNSANNFWANGIGNANDQLGRYFVTHPYFSFAATLKLSPELYQQQMGFPTLVSRHFDSPEEQKEGKFIMLNPADSPLKKLEKLMMRGLDKATIQQELKKDIVFRIDGMVEVFSKRYNWIKSVNAKNRFGLPQTEVSYTQDPGFSDRMDAIEQTVAKIFTAMGAVDIRRNKLSWRADHASGTTRMSDDPQNGIVDKDLRVHGTENLYVCSNSCMPSIGAVNPTLTLTALSIRLAEHLSTSTTS